MIPSDIEQRKRLISFINNAVEEKLIIDAANSHLSSIRKDVKEYFDMTAKEFNHYVKGFLDDAYIHELEAEVEDVAANLEILQGIKVDD